MKYGSIDPKLAGKLKSVFLAREDRGLKGPLVVANGVVYAVVRIRRGTRDVAVILDPLESVPAGYQKCLVLVGDWRDTTREFGQLYPVVLSHLFLAGVQVLPFRSYDQFVEFLRRVVLYGS